MATIGSVLISVYAKTDGLRKSLKKAEKTIGAFAKKAAKTLKTISVSIGIGATAGVAAVVAVVNKYAVEIDKLAKTSAKLGVTVKALQKLQYQAELSGLGADKFNKAFNKMTTVIADADNGLSTAVRAFDKLGINIEYIKNLSADQQFYAIAEAMKGVNSQTEKLGLAKDIFGAGATGILNTLNSNLRETSAEFESLGISVTQSGARMVEAYQDSKTKMSAIFSGFGLKLTEQLAGPFTKLIEWITKAVKDMGGMEIAAKKFAEFVIQGIKSSISSVKLLIKSFVKLENLMLRIEKLKLAPAVIGEALAQKVTGSDVVGQAGERTLQIDKAISKNNADLNNNSTIEALDKLLESLSKSVGEKIDMTDVIKPEHYKAFNKAANDANIMAESSKKAAQSTTKLAIATEKAAQAISPTKTTISTSSSYAKIGGLNPGLSGLSIGGKSTASNVVNMNSAKDIVGKTAPSMGSFTINMQTDAGEISGELFGEPKFISGLKSFSDKQTNQAARAATV